MKQVNIDSDCKGSAGGWHNWMVSMHDTTWTQLGVICNRCLRTSCCDYETYRVYHDMRNGWYEQDLAERRRNQLP
jgi:hypothetical protein